jgi:hypothetical protein
MGHTPPGGTVNGPPVQEYSGYAAMADPTCAGISISGTTVIYLSSAYATISLMSSGYSNLRMLPPHLVSEVPWSSMVYLRVNAPGSDLSELRVLFLFPPAIPDRQQVPVEDIELVDREDVNILFDEFLVEEMPAYVEVHSSPFESRIVSQCDARNDPLHIFRRLLDENLRRKQLKDGLNSTEESFGSAGGKCYGLSLCRQPVFFFFPFRSRFEDNNNVAICSPAVSRSYPVAGRIIDARVSAKTAASVPPDHVIRASGFRVKCPLRIFISAGSGTIDGSLVQG